MPLSAGNRLGPYEIVAAIGEGGMGQVYRATVVKEQSGARVNVVLNWFEELKRVK